MLRTRLRGKRTQKSPPPFYFSRFQGEPSFATSWVLKLDHRNSWPPHPFQASVVLVRLRLPCRSPLRGALHLFFYLSGEALTSLSFHLTVAHRPFLSPSPGLINLVLISLCPRTRIVPYSRRLYTPVHVALTLVQPSNRHISTHDDSSSRLYVTPPSHVVPSDVVDPTC
jgi:hypothetical protein